MSSLMRYRNFAVWLLLGVGAGCGTQPAQNPLPAGAVDAGSIDETGDQGQGLPAGQGDTVNEIPEAPAVTDEDTEQPEPIDPIGDEVLEPVPDETEIPEEELEPPVILGPDDLAGTWKLKSGGNSLTEIRSERGFETKYIEFDTNGVATIFSKSSFGGTITELPATFDVVENELLIDSETDAFDGLVLKLEMPSDDELATANALGEVAEYSRVAAVPAEARTGPLFVIKTHRFASSPHEATGLAFYKGQLWFTLGNENVCSFSPTTEQFQIRGQSLSKYKFVQTAIATAIGDILFFSCSCDNVLEAKSFVDAGQSTFGAFPFGPTISETPAITAAATDATSNEYWGSTESNRMTSLDMGLVSADFRFQTLDGLAFDGATLWGLDRAGRVLVQIDPVGGQALQSRQLPVRNVDWYDVEWVGQRLFVIGEDTSTTQTVIMELTFIAQLAGGVGGGIAGDLVPQ